MRMRAQKGGALYILGGRALLGFGILLALLLAIDFNTRKPHIPSSSRSNTSIPPIPRSNTHHLHRILLTLKLLVLFLLVFFVHHHSRRPIINRKRRRRRRNRQTMPPAHKLRRRRARNKHARKPMRTFRRGGGDLIHRHEPADAVRRFSGGKGRRDGDRRFGASKIRNDLEHPISRM
jgi:hypothetical protein